MPSTYSTPSRRATPSPPVGLDDWIPIGVAAQLAVLKMAARFATPPAVIAAHACAAGLGQKEDRR